MFSTIVITSVAMPITEAITFSTSPASAKSTMSYANNNSHVTSTISPPLHQNEITPGCRWGGEHMKFSSPELSTREANRRRQVNDA